MNHKEAYNYLIISIKEGKFNKRLDSDYCYMNNSCSKCIFRAEDGTCEVVDGVESLETFKNRLEKVRERVRALEQ